MKTAKKRHDAHDSQDRKNPVHLVHPVQNSFTDADFFRRLVADLSDSASRKNDPPTLSDVGNGFEEASLDFRRAKSPTEQFEILVSIAALCERAAVDLTIPASRQTKTGRDRRSARSASKKGANK